jgi:hypothetical protein
MVSAVREHGVRQFLEVFHRVKNRSEDVLKWGDEVRAGRGGRWAPSVQQVGVSCSYVGRAD